MNPVVGVLLACVVHFSSVFLFVGTHFRIIVRKFLVHLRTVYASPEKLAWLLDHGVNILSVQPAQLRLSDQVVLAEEESVATMTKEERELYLKNMKEMKDDDYGAGYQVELSRKPGEEPEAMELKALPAEAGVTEATAYGVAAANPAGDARVTPLTDEEREQRQREKFEREKELREQERLDWERRERDKHRWAKARLN